MLFAQTSSPPGSEVSGLNPKVLSDQFQKVQSKKELADSDSDSSAHEGAKRPFNARDAALWSQLAATVSLTQVENDWLISDLVNQQVLASTPVPYTEQLHDALNGGGVRSMSDSEHDMVWVTFTNESFTHWAVSCSLQHRPSESLILNKDDSVLWFDDLEDGGELKRLNQTSFFKKLSGKLKFILQMCFGITISLKIGKVSLEMGLLREKHMTEQLSSKRNTKELSSWQG